MKTILRLVKVDFDGLENRNPLVEKTVGVFTESGSDTALGVAAKWFEAQPLTRLYLGYDGEVYPKFKLVKEVSL